ncbi:MAG: class I SAM-dependent methyltransferase [Bacteroidetes bacterium]|nr:class I SAM-dependent methyltransferase [Bacteroidota bacterium]
MKKIIIRLIKSIPIIGTWKSYSEKYFALHAEPGKYNSPIVTWEEISDNGYYNISLGSKLKDIELNTDYQYNLLQDLKPWIVSFPFSEQKNHKYRYYSKNEMFIYNDGVLLYGVLNLFQPKKIIEVGSGYSSALMLDTCEEKMMNVKLTFIDPYTSRVDELFEKRDFLEINFVRTPVQKLGTQIYSDLEANDILFIDSSHIVKTSSDLNFIFFEILPTLRSGVLIHFHDIFFPFEYPEEWLKKGLCYNESYFLRTFLMNNDHYEIIFWNDYMVKTREDWFREISPAFHDGQGGSIYLRKK